MSILPEQTSGSELEYGPGARPQSLPSVLRFAAIARNVNSLACTGSQLHACGGVADDSTGAPNRTGPARRNAREACGLSLPVQSARRKLLGVPRYQTGVRLNHAAPVGASDRCERTTRTTVVLLIALSLTLSKRFAQPMPRIRQHLHQWEFSRESQGRNALPSSGTT